MSEKHENSWANFKGIMKKYFKENFEKTLEKIKPAIEKIIEKSDKYYNKLPLDRINEKLGGRVDVKSEKFKSLLRRVVFILVLLLVYLFFKSCIPAIGGEKCMWCGGSGKTPARELVKCNQCAGSGVGAACSRCRGSGSIWSNGYKLWCSQCSGRGREICNVCFSSGQKRIEIIVKCKVCKGWKKVSPEVNRRLAAEYEAAKNSLITNYLLQELGKSSSMPAFNNNPSSNNNNSFGTGGGGYRPMTQKKVCGVCGTTYNYPSLTRCPYCSRPQFGL